jgi:hypothetical protein
MVEIYLLDPFLFSSLLTERRKILRASLPLPPFTYIFQSLQLHTTSQPVKILAINAFHNLYF